MSPDTTTNEDIYRRLARHLDSLPAGFPPTETGVERRILRRLFTPEEARIAVALHLWPETAEEIGARLPAGLTDDPAATLESMARRGLIFRLAKDGTNHYMAAQFVIGIWEFHVNDLDEGLINDVNEYVPFLMEHTWAQMKTKQLRVIPVTESVESGAAVMAYDEAGRIIAAQELIAVAPCICRREQQMVGKGCDNPVEVCLSFGNSAAFYIENGLGREIDRDEAMKILATGLEAGLVLQPTNAKKPVNICMCCGCCCQVLKNIKRMEHPAALIDSNYFAAVDADRCTACGACAERCHMEAITVEDTAVIDRIRCIGCGVCVPACNFDALTLKPKTEAERIEPPRTMVETLMSMARERGRI
ncbi:MAG: 4Fe-4S binding protein [Deltaproteobacteria bacterium]|nr:4Fe-4S binding protein [Candidatus Anaeroferrophillacea bacterium]